MNALVAACSVTWSCSPSSRSRRSTAPTSAPSNDQEFPDRSFVAVAAVGTGDHWGFPVEEGRCLEQVWFHFHDAGDDDEIVAADFLEFLAAHALRP
ncbi:SMI1/KNR4 family protein [Winogradskya humida]|uniref:SMI1/KNR4 family protein n=1 Tax=Winogradskya humida TaxID=113566 RepID=UPI001EF39822|nr:SMI1/KNR4 family protein [Actinoplanes humidus]